MVVWPQFRGTAGGILRIRVWVVVVVVWRVCRREWWDRSVGVVVIVVGIRVLRATVEVVGGHGGPAQLCCAQAVLGTDGQCCVSFGLVQQTSSVQWQI